MFLRGAVCVPPEASAVGPPIRTQHCLSRPPSPFPEPGPRFLGGVIGPWTSGRHRMFPPGKQLQRAEPDFPTTALTCGRPGLRHPFHVLQGARWGHD